MKRILFIDKGAEGVWSSYVQLRYLLEAWTRAGLFEICPWHGAGHSARSVVPTLPEVLGDETDWDAYVVVDLRQAESALRDDVHFDNPFDFPNNYEASGTDAVKESENPLVRLCQVLGGIPEKVRLTTSPSSDGSFDYPREDVLFDLLERYRSGVPRPKRIICISPRYFDEDLYRIRGLELRQTGLEQRIDTGFWERNDYPYMTRFVVYDWQAHIAQPEAADANSLLVAEEELASSRSSRKSEAFNWLCFWSGVLSLMTADIGSSSFRPYCLYRLDPHIETDAVRRSISPRWSAWLAIREHLAAQIEAENERLRRAEYADEDLPDTEVEISINYDLDEEIKEVELLRSGLVRNAASIGPEDWRVRHQALVHSVRKALRSPRRSLSGIARRFRRMSVFEKDELEYCILNEEQMFDLEDMVHAREQRLAARTGRPGFDFDGYSDELSVIGGEVDDSMNKRVSPEALGGFVLGVGGTGLLGMLTCVPAVVQEGVNVIALSIGAVVAVAASIGVSASAVAAQHREAQRTIEKAASWCGNVKADVEVEANRLENRLAEYARLRKEWAIIRRQQDVSRRTVFGSWLSEREAMVKNRMEVVAEAVGEPPSAPEVLESWRHLPWGEVRSQLSDETLMRAVEARAVKRPFNERLGTAETIDVAFEYIGSLDLTREHIF